jgi:predicted DsbA family dithiol-disulfide isomerase
MSKRLEVQIWSDIACPWCYVGKRRFEAALSRFPHASDVHVEWRSFELDPSAPRVRAPQDYADRLGTKYGMPREQAQARIDQLVSVAQAEGLPLNFKAIQPGNTFDAHRLLHLAHTQNLQGQLKERLLRAYLCEGQAIGEHATLLQAASDVGVDVDLAQATLATDQYARQVRADQDTARRLGITGVPFFVLDQRYAVEGAQPVEVMLAALTRAHSELPALTPLSAADGAVCGPDGCTPAAASSD